MSKPRPNSYYGASPTSPMASSKVRADQSWINRTSSEESVLRPTPRKLEIGDMSQKKQTSSLVSNQYASGASGSTSPGYKSRSTSNISYSSGGTGPALDSHSSSSNSKYSDRTDGSSMSQKTTRTQTETWSSTKKDTSSNQSLWSNAWHHCTRCNHALGKKDCFILDHMKQYFHKDCFNCGLCDTPLGNKGEGDRLSVVNKQVCCDRCYQKQKRR